MIVAFEGIDACGKSTQISWLVEKAQEQGWFKSVSLISYPNYSTITGRRIQELLQEKSPDPLVLQSLMLTNRMEDQSLLRKVKKRQDELLLLDRYWWSGYAYGLFDGLPEEWLLDIHRPLVKPDLWVLLDITVTESFRRRPEREDAYESNKLRLETVRHKYKQIAMRSLNVFISKPDVPMAGLHADLCRLVEERK